MRKKEKNEELVKIDKLINSEIKLVNQIHQTKVAQIKDRFAEMCKHLEK